MAEDKKLTLAEIFLAAGKENIPLNKSDETGLTWQHKMLREASRANNFELIIEAESLHHAELAELITGLNKSIDECENLAKYGEKSREDWLAAGMPLKKKLKIKSKPLHFNK